MRPQRAKRPGLEIRQLHGRIGGLQIGHQALQIAERCGVGRRGDALPVLLIGQLTVAECAVEDRAGVVAVAVLGPGTGRLTG